MHQVLRIKYFIICICLLLGGCQPQTQSMTVGEWLSYIYESQNYEVSQTTTPYYFHIDQSHALFEVVQTLVENDVLLTQFPLDISQTLTKEFVAYTLVNMIGNDDVQLTIADIGQSAYPKHVLKSVALGIFELDKRHLFYPKAIIEKEKALYLLEKINVQKQNVLHINENIQTVDTPLYLFDNEAIFQQHTLLYPEKIIFFMYENQPYYKKIVDIVYIEEKQHVLLEEPDLSEVISELKLQNHFKVNFEDVKITPLSQEDTFMTISKQKSFTVNGFNVSYEANLNKLNITIHKGALTILGEITDFFPSYNLLLKENSFEKSDFTIQFKSTLLGKFHYDKQTTIALDDKQFKSIENALLESIPICEIKVPIPNMPLSILLQIRIDFYAGGYAQIGVYNTHTIGMKKENNELCIVNESNPEIKASLNGEAHATLGVYAALQFAQFNVLDMQAKAGLKAQMQLQQPSLSCPKMGIYNILQLELNTPRSLGYRLKMNQKYDLLNEEKGFFKMLYYADGQFQDTCKIKQDTQSIKKDVQSHALQLVDQSFILEQNTSKKIQFYKIPQQYQEDDFRFFSNSSIIQVSDSGDVSCMADGNAQVTVQSYDQLHQAFLHVYCRTP